MSRALCVSERASLACGQIFHTLTTATDLHRRAASRSRIFFVFFVCQWHKGLNVSPHNTWVLRPLNLIVSPRDTRVLRPLNLIVSPRDTWVLHPPISFCSTVTQYIVSPRYKRVRRLCYVKCKFCFSL